MGTAYLVSFATVVIPGPITLVATRLGLAHRLRAAFWFLLGATVLDALLFGALAAGAGPYLARLGALPAVEILGGLVLYGAVVAAHPREKTRGKDPGLPANLNFPFWRYFLFGMGVSSANPHYWFWWITAGLAFVEGARAYGKSGLAWILGALLAGVVSWYAPLLVALQRRKTLLGPRSERFVVQALSMVLFILGLSLVALGGYRLGIAVIAS